MNEPKATEIRWTVAAESPIRPEGSYVTSAAKREYQREYKRRKAAEKAQAKAQALATGQMIPKEPKVTRGSKPQKTIVNRVTEYGALFNALNQERVDKGLPPLKTAMEVLIEAMQSDEIELKDKARIAEKMANFESSRAPIISIEHVQNVLKDEDATADDSVDEFLESLRKV